MKPLQNIAYAVVVLLILGCATPEGEAFSDSQDVPQARAVNYVQTHGKLQVQGPQLLDASGAPVRLKGMSSFWINWSTGGKYANANVVEQLVKDWGVSVYRIALGVNPGDKSGYVHRPGTLLPMVRETIEACIELGIYVIVDWHAHDTLGYLEEEKAFFSLIAREYGHTPNIIYEIWNEPTSMSWSRQIKPYCEAVINEAIRPYDPDNIIIVGSSTWSQDVHKAAADPIEGDNLMYSLHFYAGTHGSALRSQAERAMKKGIALFVTEWGTSNADGGGGADRKLYVKESDIWISWMDAHGLSWLNWSVADKDEVSAALKPGAPTNGLWGTSWLSPSGVYIKGKLLE
ncbi:MAG: glycoside hydrolase family 5 protein [Spirochaetales bacterium]|nr:glycoside hydrolase family 5 protein [Spirochaetales bacterium]